MHPRHLLPLALSLPLVSTALTAHAEPEPNEYLEMPGGEHGERQMELRSGHSRNRDGSSSTAHALAFGYGITQRWFSEIIGKWQRDPGGQQEWAGVEWENKFLILESGEHPVGLSALLEIERPEDRSEGYELRFGPMLETRLGKWQVNFNPLLSRNVHAEESGRTELGYQLQFQHPWRPGLQWGVQGFGDVGPWDDWLPSGEQSHRFGPAVFGTVKLDGERSFIYDAALLAVTSDAAPKYTLRVQVELEFD